MHPMHKFVWIVLALAVSSCAAHQPPTLPPGGQTIVIAKQAAVAIGTLQGAAIGLNKIQVCDPQPCHPALSDHNTGIVVDAATDALKAMRAVPDGWLATADAALERVTTRLDAGGRTQFDPYLAGARTTLEKLRGQ
jgi:hypothetical protein